MAALHTPVIHNSIKTATMALVLICMSAAFHYLFNSLCPNRCLVVSGLVTEIIIKDYLNWC